MHCRSMAVWMSGVEAAKMAADPVEKVDSDILRLQVRQNSMNLKKMMVMVTIMLKTTMVIVTIVARDSSTASPRNGIHSLLSSLCAPATRAVLEVGCSIAMTRH